jgi:hypothetical protein
MEDEFKRAFQTAGDQLMLITSILFDLESEFNAGQGFIIFPAVENKWNTVIDNRLLWVDSLARESPATSSYTHGLSTKSVGR